MSKKIETKVEIEKMCASDYLNYKIFLQAVADWEEQAYKEWELYWGKEEVYQPQIKVCVLDRDYVYTLKKMDPSVKKNASEKETIGYRIGIDRK